MRGEGPSTSRVVLAGPIGKRPQREHVGVAWLDAAAVEESPRVVAQARCGRRSQLVDSAKGMPPRQAGRVQHLCHGVARLRLDEGLRELLGALGSADALNLR